MRRSIAAPCIRPPKGTRWSPTASSRTRAASSTARPMRAVRPDGSAATWRGERRSSPPRHEPPEQSTMATHLMLSRRFAPLFWCQFFSAFNDNFLKNALVILILFKLGGSHAGELIQLAAATFIAPFFFLSGLGGQLADRFDKAVVARRLKLAEIAVCGIAVAGFTYHSIWMLFVALGLFGVIAALFGPIKYGILPDHLAREELPAGNALVEGATFLAILIGTIAGGIAMKDGGDPAVLAVTLMLFAVLCWAASLF